MFALSTAHAYISSGLYKTALVIGADLLSKLVDWTDRSTCVLFGDGAGAAVVTAAENGIIGLNMHSNGAKGGVLTCGSRSTGNFLLGKKPELGYMTMEGQEVFKFAVKQVPECIKEVLDVYKRQDLQRAANRLGQLVRTTVERPRGSAGPA